MVMGRLSPLVHLYIFIDPRIGILGHVKDMIYHNLTMTNWLYIELELMPRDWLVVAPIDEEGNHWGGVIGYERNTNMITTTTQPVLHCLVNEIQIWTVEELMNAIGAENPNNSFQVQTSHGLTREDHNVDCVDDGRRISPRTGWDPEDDAINLGISEYEWKHFTKPVVSLFMHSFHLI